jgi:hypothetical protein
MLIFKMYESPVGARGSIVVKHYATNRKVAGWMPDEENF